METKQRILSLFLCIVVLLEMLPGNALAANNNNGGILNEKIIVWDGTIANNYAGGRGTEDDPYQIENGEQLALLSADMLANRNRSAYFVLTSDIHLNRRDNYGDWAVNPPSNIWVPVGGGTTYEHDNTAFHGFFDGQNHTVYGLYTNPDTSYNGLFGLVSGGEIKNLTIKNSYICGIDTIGSIAARVGWGTTIDNCHNYAIVTGTSNVGGIVGLNSTSCTYMNCSNIGTVTGANAVGGIVGLDASGRGGAHISCSLNQGAITGDKWIGGIIGNIENNSAENQYSVYNCYNSGKITCITDTVGGIVGGLIHWREIENCYNVGIIEAKDSVSNRGAIAGYCGVGSKVLNCYYLDSCGAGGSGIAKSVEKLGMKNTFSGFDFDEIWYFDHKSDYSYPSLVGVNTTLCAKIVIADKDTNNSISDAYVYTSTGELTYIPIDGACYIVGTKTAFASDVSIHVAKSGYENFVCYSSDLNITASVLSAKDNIIYLTPVGIFPPAEDTATDLYILEHTNFAKDSYPRFSKTYGFQNAYWQFDNGDSLALATVGNYFDNINELIQLDFDGIKISVNYYDLFLIDLISAMADLEYSNELEASAFKAYSMNYSKVSNNWISFFKKLDEEKDDLLSEEERVAWDFLISDLEAINNGTGNVGWDAVAFDIEMLLRGEEKDFEMSDQTKNILEFVCDSEFVKQHQDRLNDVFEGFSIANEVSGYITSAVDKIDAFQNTSRAYVTAATHESISDNLMTILQEAASKMEGARKIQFEIALNKYKNLNNDKIKLYRLCMEELIESSLEFSYDNFFKSFVKKAVYSDIASVLGCPATVVKAVIKAYNIGYAFSNKVSGLSDKCEQYTFMYYVAPVEAALESVVADYGNSLLPSGSYEDAEKYDYTYRTLKETNKYLYNCWYTIAASGETIFNLPEVMELSTMFLNIWDNSRCHGTSTLVTNRYKYTSIQCPVDVYVYGPGGELLVSIIDDEVVECSASILVMNYAGVKTLMYPADVDYSFKIIAREEGTMQYSVSEIEDTTVVRCVDFYDLQLETNQVFTGVIPSEFGVDGSAYNLLTNSVNIQYDYDSILSTECNSEHSYGEWIIEMYPSVENNGLKTHTCTKCGKKERIAISAFAYDLVSIENPVPITGVKNGTVLENIDFPAAVAIVTTDDGPISASVAWDTSNVEYNPINKAKQTFSTPGVISLPAGVNNPNEICLDITVYVTVNGYDQETPPITTYSLTVQDGSGDGNYTTGSQISITANATPSGKIFDHWISNNGGSFADATNPNTIFTMPSNDVTVTAIYRDQDIPPIATYAFTLQADTGGRISEGANGQYTEGDLIQIAAVANADYRFDKWTSSNGGSFTKVSNTSTTFIMPSDVTTVTASFVYEGSHSSNSSSSESSSSDRDDTSKQSLLKENYTMTDDTITISHYDLRTLVNAKENLTLINDKKLSLTFDTKALQAILDMDSSDVTFTIRPMNIRKWTEAQTAIGNRPVFNFEVSYNDGKEIRDFRNGKVSISIPYTVQQGEQVDNVQAVYMDENGKLQWLINSKYDNTNKILQFNTNYLSIFGVGYKTVPSFLDIDNHWAKNDILFVANRKLFSGTSSTTFSPDAAMTRGMFVTVLGRLANAEINDYKTSSFSDVSAEAYYMSYVEWANKNGIVNGVGDGKFAPDQPISREQMAAIMVNYAKAMSYSLPKNRQTVTFVDGASISSWAAEAVKTMQMAGVLNGKNDNCFDPQGRATRAETAAVLHRYVKLITDSIAI